MSFKKKTLGSLAVIGTTLAASYIVGGLTCWVQTFLAQPVQSFANSSIDKWALITACLIWSLRIKPSLALLLGPISMITLVYGYDLMAGAMEIPQQSQIWGVSALVLGPFVGLSAAWLRYPGWRAALGASAISAVGLSDSVTGLATGAATPHPFYWILIGLLAAGLLAYSCYRLRRTPRFVALGLLATAAGTSLMTWSYFALGF